jgi:hypothetical protein
VVKASPETVPHLYRSDSRINMEQPYHDVNSQNWSAIYDMPDPYEQLRHFNATVLGLLDLHVPLRRYIQNDDDNPWFTWSWLSGILHIEYEKGGQDRNQYKQQRNRVNYMVREVRRSYIKIYLNPNLTSKN